MEEELLSELKLLTSMYDASDIHFDDPEILLKIQNSIPISSSVSLTVKINEHLKIHIRIPPNGYPHSEKLSASCDLISCSSNNNQNELIKSRLNNDLNTQIQNGNEETINILGVINWCNNQWDLIYSSDEFTNSEQSGIVQEENICRIWIHSHHIYNEKKRKFLVETASKLDLGGFSLPGKPGFICVEGDPKNCDDFWSTVRQLTWQKISLIERQILKPDENVFDNTFEELLIDKSSFMKYLHEKNISSIIKDYLGF